MFAGKRFYEHTLVQRAVLLNIKDLKKYCPRRITQMIIQYDPYGIFAVNPPIRYRR